MAACGPGLIRGGHALGPGVGDRLDWTRLEEGGLRWAWPGGRRRCAYLDFRRRREVGDVGQPVGVVDGRRELREDRVGPVLFLAAAEPCPQ